MALVTLLSVAIAGATAQTYSASQLHPGEVPEVYGDPEFKATVQAALDYLRLNYPGDYDNVTFWLSEVRPTDTYTRVNSYGICYLNAADCGNYFWTAGVLIHEAQHVQDDGTYFIEHPYTADESELRALTVQAAYLASINGWTDDQESEWVDGWFARRYWETIPGKYE